MRASVRAWGRQWPRRRPAAAARGTAASGVAGTAGALTVAAAVVMVVVVAVTAGCGEQHEPARSPAGGDGPAPDYTTILAQGLPRVDLPAIERLIDQTAGDGRVLVLDFWATWCGICVAIFADVHDAVEALGDDVRLVTITLDNSEAETLAINFLAEHHALRDAYMLRPDTGSRSAVATNLGERWRDGSLPAILVFDRDGELAAELLGADVEPGRITETVEEVLASREP